MMKMITKRILIVGDSYIPSNFFKKALEDVLQNIKDIKIVIETIDLNNEGAFGYPESIEVQEKKIIEKIEDKDILVVSMAPVTSRVIEAGKRLKLICCPRGAPLNIDINAAIKRGVLVVNAPDRSTNAVAELTIGLMLSIARHITKSACAFKNGIVLTQYECLGTELEGKTLGIVGFGSVGSCVAKKARALGMKVLVYDPYAPEDKILKVGGEKVELERLLKESDFVSLHPRLSPETFQMIGEKELALMKRNAYLINTSRGLVVDEKALYEALRNQKIAGAALDVLIRDRDPSTPLARLDNVIITPHIGGTTYEGQIIKSVTTAAEEIKRFLAGEELKFIVKPEPFAFERQLILEGKVRE